MKTFVVKEKRSAPAIRRSQLSRFGYRGPEVKAQRAAIRRILRSNGAQAKLTIGPSNDKYEQEADRVADQVMAMPDPKLQCQPENEEEEETLQTKPLAGQITPLVQRQEEPPEEEEELQTKSKHGETPTVTPSLESRINSLEGGGRPLPESTRAFFEPRFGCDFGKVRVHSDTKAETFNRELNARSFTSREHIFFRRGEYDPESTTGRQLLAHELTHIVQQRASNLYRSPVVQQRKGAEPAEKTYLDWLGEVGERYTALKHEVEDAGYEIEYRVLTGSEWQQVIAPSHLTPINKIKWKIKPPNKIPSHLRLRRTPFWANSRRVLGKLEKIVRVLRAAKQEEGIEEGTEEREERERVKFYNDPSDQNVRVKGKWILLSNTEEGIKYYEEKHGEDFVVDVYCYAAAWEKTKVKLKTGQWVGIGYAVGPYAHLILVKTKVGGRLAITAETSDFFATNIRYQLASDSKFGRYFERICKEQLFRQP